MDGPQARYMTLERMVRDQVLDVAVQNGPDRGQRHAARSLQEIPQIVSLKADGSLDVEIALVGAQGMTPGG
jgi:peptidyl-prolyl cis-trans isomerase D